MTNMIGYLPVNKEDEWLIVIIKYDDETLDLSKDSYLVLNTLEDDNWNVDYNFYDNINYCLMFIYDKQNITIGE